MGYIGNEPAAQVIDASDLEGGPLGNDVFPTGAVVQSAYAQHATRTTSNVSLPADNTIPQNTEGAELITVSITPRSASNVLRVRFTGTFRNGTGTATGLVLALFRDSGADAKAALFTNCDDASLVIAPLQFSEVAGSTSATTYKLRFGPNAAAGSGYAANGGAAANIFGGVDFCSLVVEEIKA